MTWASLCSSAIVFPAVARSDGLSISAAVACRQNASLVACTQRSPACQGGCTAAGRGRGRGRSARWRYDRAAECSQLAGFLHSTHSTAVAADAARVDNLFCRLRRRPPAPPSAVCSTDCSASDADVIRRNSSVYYIDDGFSLSTGTGGCTGNARRRERCQAR